MRPSILAFAVVWALFAGWTIRRLWRRATDRYTQIVYMYGVKGFGLGYFVLMMLQYVFEGASQRRLLIQLIVGPPLSLWGGYLFGRGMAWSLGVKSDERAV